MVLFAENPGTFRFHPRARDHTLAARDSRTPDETMVDYSKWDNLDSGDSDSDSGGDAAAVAKTKRQQQQKQLQEQRRKQDSSGVALSSRKAADDKRALDQAEVLRYGCCALELRVAVFALEVVLEKEKNL